MDTVGTFEMAKALGAHKMVTALHKHYRTSQIVEFVSANPSLVPFVAVSSGTSESDFKKLSEVVSESKVDMICLDVANGTGSFSWMAGHRRCTTCRSRYGG